MATIDRTGEHISMTERRAMEAERDTIDRYVAAFLAQHVGEVMEARITGVTNFGFFATVAGLGGGRLAPGSTPGAGGVPFHEASTHLASEAAAPPHLSGLTLQPPPSAAQPR